MSFSHHWSFMAQDRVGGQLTRRAISWGGWALEMVWLSFHGWGAFAGWKTVTWQEPAARSSLLLWSSTRGWHTCAWPRTTSGMVECSCCVRAWVTPTVNYRPWCKSPQAVCVGACWMQRTDRRPLSDSTWMNLPTAYCKWGKDWVDTEMLIFAWLSGLSLPSGLFVFWEFGQIGSQVWCFMYVLWVSAIGNALSYRVWVIGYRA